MSQTLVETGNSDVATRGLVLSHLTKTVIRNSMHIKSYFNKIYSVLIIIGVAPITQATHVRNKK